MSWVVFTLDTGRLSDVDKMSTEMRSNGCARIREDECLSAGQEMKVEVCALCYECTINKMASA